MSDRADGGFDDIESYRNSQYGYSQRGSSSDGAGAYSRSSYGSSASQDEQRQRSAYRDARYQDGAVSSSSQRVARRQGAAAHSRRPATDQGAYTRRISDAPDNEAARREAARNRAAARRAASTQSEYSAEAYGSQAQPRRSAASQRQSATQRSTAAQRTHRSEQARVRQNGGQRVSAHARSASAPQPKKRSKRPIVIVVAVVLAVALIGVGGAFAYMNLIAGNLHKGVDDDLRSALVETDMANEPFYMLLLGTDKSTDREDTGELDGIYRTDSMMLARIDPVNNKATLISIPRDTLVDLGEDGWQKVNSAYAFGGPSLAVEAVSKLAGVDIAHYAEIDFDGFAAMVDALGGVEVDVPIDIDDWEAGGSLSAGVQTLNGEQALILCRTRNAYSETSAAPDLMRAANQRLVLSAIAHKLLASDVVTIANTVSAVSNYVTTDLEVNDIIGVAQTMKGLNTEEDMYTCSFPTDSGYIQNGVVYPDMYTPVVIGNVDPAVEDGYYLIPNEEEWAKMKQRLVDGLPPSEGSLIDEKTGTVLATAGSESYDTSDKNCWITIKNATERDGLAKRAMGLLNTAGFENITLEDMDMSKGPYPKTLVVYNRPGQAKEAEVLVKALGQGEAIENDGSYLVDNDFLVIVGDDWKDNVAGGA